MVIIHTMAKAKSKTMSELLKGELAAAKSVNGVAVATGVPKASLIRFMRGDQSLRLDKADKLAAYFGVVSHGTKRTEQR